MPRTEKYFIGPQLLGDIRQTVNRVAGMPQGSRIGKIPTRLQEMRPPGSGGEMWVGKTSSTWPKGSTRDIVVHGGDTLNESPTTTTLNACVNKFSDVAAGKWVIVGRVNGGWYLIAAECP